MSIALSAVLDGAGDGWVEIRAQASPLRGLHLRLVACSDAAAASDSCLPVAVFGGAGGAAEAAGWFVSAGHALAHGVYGFCLDGPCEVSGGGGEGPLLTRLSVALPLIGRSTVVCTSAGDRLFAGVGAEPVELPQVCAGRASRQPARQPPETAAREPASRRVRACAPPQACSQPLVFGGNVSAGGGRSAFVKTYKTGSSTLASLLQRRADSRGLDVAVNARAVPHPLPSLEPHLAFKEKWARPTDCLYESHTFKECGAAFLSDQASGGVPAPKPFGLVVDHSRLQPLLASSGAGGSSGAARPGLPRGGGTPEGSRAVHCTRRRASRRRRAARPTRPVRLLRRRHAPRGRRAASPPLPSPCAAGWWPGGGRLGPLAGCGTRRRRLAPPRLN